jgi:hypothetical protein
MKNERLKKKEKNEKHVSLRSKTAGLIKVVPVVLVYFR